MGVYIKGMEMPKSCDECPMYTCMFNYDSCPLVPVPPHGRLGDLDKLESGLRLCAKYQNGDRQQGMLGCCETIRLAPTIIPADPAEETTT